MREFLGIDRSLQSIQGEVVNNISKLTEIDKYMKKDSNILNKVEHDLTYCEEQRQLYKDRYMKAVI